MTTQTAETMQVHVDRFNDAFDRMPTVDTESWTQEQVQDWEESVARIASDPETILLDEGIYLVVIAEVLLKWWKLPQHEATRQRLSRMIDEALAEDKD